MFWYQLNDKDDTKTTLFRITGNQGNAWKEGSLEIYDNGYEVIFQGTVGNGEVGDIAIDSVQAAEKSCSESFFLCRIYSSST